VPERRLRASAHDAANPPCTVLRPVEPGVRQRIGPGTALLGRIDRSARRVSTPLTLFRQVRARLDIVNDGELAKISYVTYVRDRLTGFMSAAETPPRTDPMTNSPSDATVCRLAPSITVALPDVRDRPFGAIGRG
jgi:hypothetical protein